jgi:hypothetical protein
MLSSMSGTTLVTIAVLSVWASVLGWLYRRFSRAGARRPDALAAAAALAIGTMLLAIPGALHTLVIGVSAVRHHRAYDGRLAWLFVIGLVVIYAGVSTIATAGGSVAACAKRSRAPPGPRSSCSPSSSSSRQ